MHVRRALRVLLTVPVVAITMLATTTMSIVPAGAITTSTGSLVYSGSASNSTTLIDTGLIYIDGCDHGDLAIEPDDPTLCFPDSFPGTLWGHVEAGVDFTVVQSQTADIKLDAPDTFRQDTTAPFSVTLTAKDAAGHEVKVQATPWIEIDLAYDAPLANCPKSTITTVAQLDVADTSGCLNAVWHPDRQDLGEFEIFAKDMLYPYTGAATATDTHSSPELDLGAFIGFPEILKLRLDVDVSTTLTATLGYHGERSVATASDPGTPLATSTLTFPSADPLADNVQIPCSATAGDNLVYKLTDNKWDGTAKVDVQPKVVIVTPFGDVGIPLGSAVNLFDEAVSLPAAPDFTAGLGEILPENKPPVIGAVNAPTGNEGTPINLTATATDNCGTPTLRWDFSDGGVAFGASVYHTFTDNGTYSGLVTATDGAGNTAAKTFSVTVNNMSPSVNAGPDTTADWKRLVSFNGQATDPGASDQSTLQYTWDFGDGSPSASGGPSVAHMYNAPGSYVATLTVCDKDQAPASCPTDTRTVNITKRDSTTGYTGPSNAGVSKNVTLSASLVDEYGQPIVGRTVAFALGTQSISAITNNAGVASATIKLNQKKGTVNASATFATDTMYNASNSTTSFKIG